MAEAEAVDVSRHMVVFGMDGELTSMLLPGTPSVPRKLNAELEDLVLLDAAAGGPYMRSAGAVVWLLPVREVLELLSDPLGLASVIEHAKSGMWSHCQLPVGVAAWLMGEAAHIRLNGRGADTARSVEDSGPVWPAVLRWREQALVKLRRSQLEGDWLR